MKRSALLLASFLVLGLAAPPAYAGSDGAKYAEIVAAPDRSDADRALDEGREPAELLRSSGSRRG